MNAISSAITANKVKDFLLIVLILAYFRKVYKNYIIKYGIFKSLNIMIQTVLGVFMKGARAYNATARKVIESKLDESLQQIKKEIKKPRQNHSPISKLPESGTGSTELRIKWTRYESMSNLDYKNGKISGAVYHDIEDLYSISAEAYNTNPLHADLFPGIQQMENEVVSMILNLYHGEGDHCGSFTSGGTESILLACKAYRDRARQLFNIKNPEIILSESAHCAFDKAAHYFNIKLISIPPDETTGMLDPFVVSSLITRNTILIVGSAPSFNHGIVDPIQELASIAKKHQIGFHVDCCLGGFLIPFMEEAGFEFPIVDFRIEGVTSISCDPHKYGFTPKGASVIMYSSKELRKYQYYINTEWTGGIYASPTLSGSRSGALIASCWSVLLAMGRQGYVESTKTIITAARAIAAGIQKIPELQVIGNPQLSVVGISSKTLNIYQLNDQMSKRGWNLNALQNPKSIHIAVTLVSAINAKQFLTDLKQAAEKCHLQDLAPENNSSAAIYGMATTIPDRSLVKEIATGYLDALQEN